ncbi:MAG: glycerophosphoryl diester phosphodiesterase [Cycloclasticus sp.]|nr:glycerophosphoryl diester phosphodiesterase [Cycloclasticus sp.]
MLVIGHRGAMGTEPENTLLSIRRAIDMGVDCVEIDVYYVNGQLIVIHDDSVDRTTNGRGKLAALSFEQLRCLDAGKGEKIPTLNEVIDVTKNKVDLNIELKGLGVSQTVVELVQALDKTVRNHITISSFNMLELQDAFQRDSTIKIGVLANAKVGEAFEWAKKLNAYSVNFKYSLVTKNTVSKAHKLGFKLYVYTVNSPSGLQQMKALGVDGVFTNFPERALAIGLR